MTPAEELNPREMLSVLSRVLPGDRPDHCTQRCLCVLRPRPRPLQADTPLPPAPPSTATSQSESWPVAAGRLNVTTLFFFSFYPPPGCPLRTLHPINFHSLFTGIPGLYMPTSSDLQHLHKRHKDAHKSVGDPSADAETPLEDDCNVGW